MSITRKKNGSVSHASVPGVSAIFSPNMSSMPSGPDANGPAGGGGGGGGGGGIGIQMGNTLAAKTASLANPQTMYQMCSDIRKRLRRVRGYERFLERPVDAPRLDVVNHVWLSFRLGSSLCHLFNMLLPIFDPDAPPPIPIEFPDFDYPEEQGVLTWGTLPQNVKQCKRGAAKFIVTLTNLQKEGRWPDSDPLWAIHELFRDDTGGLVKVLRTIGILMDKLPASAWVREESNSPSTPYPVERSGFLTGSQETFLGSNVTAVPGHSSTSAQGQPSTRPPSSASIHHPSHRSQLSTASSHGVPRSGLDTPPLQGPMPTSGAVALTRPGPGLFINTSLDRSKSYSGSNGTIPGTATPDPQLHVPSSALPQLETRQGDVRPVDCGQAAMHVWEILKTEKKYVQELEILQAYSQSLLQHSLVAPDTVHLIFSNLGKLLDFQRRFLTQLETQYEPVVESGGNAWVEGNWGYPWVSMEKDFEVYEPYCANYLNAIQLIEKEKENLDRVTLSLSTMELPAFVISPIQRICKYPLLLQNLVDSSASTDYAHKDELARGLVISKRIADSVNETLRQHSNLGLVEELKTRVKDWKGHSISEFGRLLLDGQFIITKSEQDRDYSIYLFERMILCCKEVIPEKKDKRAGKSGSILKKQNAADKTAQAAPPKKNQLSLKGRIYVNNLTGIERSTSPNGEYTLKIMWRQQDDPDGYEFFVMHVKSSETVNKWEAEIQKLMRADALRREERERRSMQRQHQYMPSSANFPLTPASDRMYRTTPSGEYFTEQDAHRQQWDDDGLTAANTPSTTASNTPNSFVASSRRTMSGQGIPDRYSAGGPSRTSDDHYHGNALSQWRYNQNGMPAMPPLPRAVSSSVTDQGPDGHYRSNSRSISGPARHYLHDVHDDRSGGLPYLAESSEEVLRPSMAIANARYANGIGMLRSGSGVGGDPSTPQQHPAALRMRSASSPNVYQVPHVNAQSNARQPPMPFAVSAAMTPGSSGQSWNSSRDDVLRQPGQFGNKPYGPSALPLAATSETQLSVSDFAKRSSNSSESTELSELSSHSPETPYGGQIGDSMQLRPRVSSGDSSKNVIIKVHFNHDIFKLKVPHDIDCSSLKDRVIRKVRLCGGRREDRPIKCYYRDEEQERLRLDADEDLLTLFDPVSSGLAREVELEVNEA